MSKKILNGADSTQGIVSVSASRKGTATVWRRVEGAVRTEVESFHNWFVIADLTLLENVKAQMDEPLYSQRIKGNTYEVKELEGEHPIKYQIFTKNYQVLERGIVANYNAKHNTSHRSFYDLPNGVVVHFPATEQYLISTGRTYFKEIVWEDLHRLQFDLETYTLDPKDGGIFLIAITDNRGFERIIDETQLSEAEIIRELIRIIQERDPDVIENHNIFAFDLPFLEHRAKMHKIKLTFGRDGSGLWTQRGTLKVGESTLSFTRYCMKGREIIDTLHAVRRWNAIAREITSEGLKEAAQHFSIATLDREYIEGGKIPEIWKSDPDRVRRYAFGDVREVAELSNMLMRDKFILAEMVPMPFEKVATAGTASCLDSMMVRAYLSQSHSLPQPQPKVKFKGGETELIAEGVTQNVLHADVSSMYPSIMLNYNVKPENDNMDVFLTILRELTNIRLSAKGKLKTFEKGTLEYNNIDALQGGMKILINSAFGYMGATFTVFNDPKQAGEVTRHGREILSEMLTAVKELGGQTIEADTDGIYLALPENANADEFIKGISDKVNREGIKIDGEEYRAMYSIAKKEYALLTNDDEIVIKGGGLKSRDTEPFLTEFISAGLGYVLRNNVDGLRRCWANVVDRLRDGNITVEEISKTTKLSKSVADYMAKHKVRQPHYEAAIAADRTDLKAGERIEYYKGNSGWKLATEFDSDYDIRHYLNRLKQTAQRFRKALTATDFRTLFTFEKTLFENATKIIRFQFQILEDEPREWIELAHGIKLNAADQNYEIDRHNWINYFPLFATNKGLQFEVSDTSAIEEFRKKHDNVDLYRTQLAVVAEKEPTGNLDQYPRVGDFWLEFEGSKDDMEKKFKALEAAHCAYDAVEKLFGCAKQIRYRYNGGKSIYLFLPMSVFEKASTYNLEKKYEKVAQRITQELPKKLRKIPDLRLYETNDRVLRLEGSIYPDGGYDVEVPVELILTENWNAIKALSQEGQAEPLSDEKTEEPEPLRSEASWTLRHTETLDFYEELTKDVPSDPPKRGGRGRRNHKRKQAQREWREHFGNLGIPCAKALAEAVAAGESIGFEGRNKLIWELRYSDIEENTICKLFLSCGNPTRYGVLEEDTRPNGNACGYRLKDRFNPFSDMPPDFDPSCSHFPHICEPTKCYRAEEYRGSEVFKQVSFSEFREKARNELREVIRNEDNFAYDPESKKRKINAADASIASGKTYQIALNGKERTSDGYTVIAFNPTHEACTKTFYELSSNHGGVAKHVIAVHVYGQREETCIGKIFKRGISCASCKYNKKFYDGEEGQALREIIQRECQGRVLDLKELQELSKKYDTCVSAISKILAKPDIEGIAVFAVMPHAYLINRQNRRLIESINPDYVFVDEADMLIDTMLGEYQRSLQIAGTRSRADRIYSMPCGHQCNYCHIHFSDTFTNRIRPRAKLDTKNSYETIPNPSHFIEYLRETVKRVKKMVQSGTIIDIFDFEAIKRNIDRLQEVLTIISYNYSPLFVANKGLQYEGQTPYEYLTSMQKALMESPSEGVKVDCLYEGLSYKELDEKENEIEKIIRPPVHVTKIEVEGAFTEEGLRILSFPDWAADPDITPKETLSFVDASAEEAALLSKTIAEEKNIRPKDVYVDNETTRSLKDTESENSLRGFLAFANFTTGAISPGEKKGWVEMYFETPQRHDEAIDEEVEEVEQEDGSFYRHVVKRAGISYCAIRLRYLDVEGYRSTVKFLQRRKTMMLSGTFLDKDRLAENLLLKSDEVNYIDARVPMHDAALIIHHNPHMGKLIRSMTGISLSAFGDWQALELYNRIAELRNPTSNTKILHYAVNTRRGNIIYGAVENTPYQNAGFYVENECNKRTQIPEWCSAEKTLLRKGDWLFFDKVRSSTSRAVDREQFHILTVHRNGYPDWYDMLPLTSAIREYVNPDVDLEAIIEYNRQRAVFQTLLRNQRNEQRHVSIYLSGDLHYTAYPDYLRNRVLETNALMRKIKEMYPDDFLSNRQVQIEMIARVAVAFLEEKLNDIDAFMAAEVMDPNDPPEILEAVFGDFEFIGDYGKGESSRKVEINLSNLSDNEQYLIESFVDEHSEGTDHARAYQTAIERLEHVKKCIADKGYVELRADKKGERKMWQTWLEHLIDKNYLVETSIETGRRPKKVYKIADGDTDNNCTKL